LSRSTHLRVHPSGTYGVNRSNPSLVDQLSLWPHQRAALEQMESYLDAYAQRETRGSALVHMPTGSGKTGIIAALARCRPQSGCVLVLTPRIALRQQLVRDVGGRFFECLASAPPAGALYKQVVELDGDSGELDFTRLGDLVLVSTIQKIQSMARREPKRFRRLCQQVSLLMFDEGHYEPAYTWSH